MTNFTQEVLNIPSKPICSRKRADADWNGYCGACMARGGGPCSIFTEFMEIHTLLSRLKGHLKVEVTK